MTTSSPEHPTKTTGAHRAHRRAHRRPHHTSPQSAPARYEPYLDGLFTYCLSVLCDHDAATAALGDVLALAERRTARGPEGARDRRAWLYALARWACLRRLAEARSKRQGGAHAGGRPAPAPGKPTGHAERTGNFECDERTGDSERPTDSASAADAEARTRQLARLAWPEAAGTSPEQREALELAVRHGLGAAEVADVLGMDRGAARELLAAAACEVERTRAALAVVETGTCPSVARLTGDNQLLLGAALRAELVRHVDDCPRCRRTAERAGASAWPGTTVSPAGSASASTPAPAPSALSSPFPSPSSSLSAPVTPAALPVLPAPRAAVHAAMLAAARVRGGMPRFDRRGFPMDPKDRAARRDRLRARAVTTTVVATVVAAPVLALWAAYRGAPLTGESDGRPLSASEAGGPDGLYGESVEDTYENAGNAHSGPDPRYTAGSRSPDVSVEVISPGAAPTKPGKGPGRLTVDAQPNGDTTLITLTASGGRAVDWSAHTAASWLRFSRSAGTLQPGESLTIQVWLDHARQPTGAWSARIAVEPGNAVVIIDGYGPGAPGPGPVDPSPRPPSPTNPGSPSPSDPGPSDPGSPEPTDPGTSDPTDPGSPSPSDPDPSDPGSPAPSDSGSPAPSDSGPSAPGSPGPSDPDTSAPGTSGAPPE
ncbi:BACON domain-containing protein [Streptomyces sp. KLOTTS4A1]|uniref:BACON domain-containing protein n=1 Tax=Streptomyces sp. KLOTTS4A1 TaxID=3390996 RepID=UPI0039F60BEE